MKLGLAVARVIVGMLFVGHGTQKLLGWFGGGGPEGTGQFFESAGLRPGRRNALAAGAAETAGGALLTVGLATPLAATLLSGVMATAGWTVHREKGPWMTDGGYEYNLALIGLLFALTDVGPGEWSLDDSLGLDLSGPGWALAELAAAAAGAAATIKLARGQTAGEGPAEAATGGA